MSTAYRQARRLPTLPAWLVRSRPAAHPWAIISAGLAPILLTGAGYPGHALVRLAIHANRHGAKRLSDLRADDILCAHQSRRSRH